VLVDAGGLPVEDCATSCATSCAHLSTIPKHVKICVNLRERAQEGGRKRGRETPRKVDWKRE